MYGWLETSIGAAHAWFADPGERVLRVSPVALAHWLPMLGSVLYVPSRSHMQCRPRLPDNLLTESALLAPLLRTRYLRVLGTVSADGPREWIDCLDARGDVLAQVHLLPDTDYLAWDNLPSGCEPLGAPDLPWRASAFRGAAAHLVRFRCQSLATLSCLGEAPPPRISALGRIIAQTIAGAQPLLMQGMPIAP